MKNLKLKLILFLALLSSTTLFSQGFYVTAGGGYAFTMNGQRTGIGNEKSESTYNYQTNNSTSSSTIESVSLSYGKGFNFNGALGYMFNEYVGIDLGFNYLFGGKTVTESYSKHTEILQSSNNVFENTNKTSNYSRMFRVIPSLIVTPNFDKINPYIKIGAVIGFGSFYAESNRESLKNGSHQSTSSYISKSNGGVAFGFNSALGVTYDFSERMSLFGEVNYIGMTYAPHKSIRTKWEVDGVDQLPNLPTNQKETEYVDELTQVQNSNNPDEPTQQLFFSQPFNSLGFNVGVKFSLNPSN